MEKADLYLRCIVDDGQPPQVRRETRPNHNRSLVFVLDTETTIDRYQNLLFGSAGLWAAGRLKSRYLFYNERLVKASQISLLESYANRGYEVLNRSDFVENVFYPVSYGQRAITVGFNNLFDYSRLAIAFAQSRKWKDGFSYTLSDNPLYPRILGRSLDSKRSLIEFANPLVKHSQKKFPSYKGYFVDLRTATFALTNRSYKLETAAIDFETELRKTDTDQLGLITPETIEYNINNVMVTYQLYLKVLLRLELFGVKKELNRLYSPASLSKALLHDAGIKSFQEKNPDFPLDMQGLAMEAYYGGRTGVGIRLESRQVTYKDFTSMYPTQHTLQKMDELLKAQKLVIIDSTRDTQLLLNTIKWEDLFNKDLWPTLRTICLVKPDGDVLPARSPYGNKNAIGIGINYVTTVDGTFLSSYLFDLIASKQYTGKAPIIEKAYTVKPEGVQDGLKGVKILDVTIEPGDDLVKTLVELRERLKREKAGKTDEEKHQIDLKRDAIKTISNAIYGINVELNPEDTKKPQQVTVHGSRSFTTTVNRIEKRGPAFNPMIGPFLTAGARLILAMTEKLVTDNGGYFAYCDTDGVFISPEHEKLVRDTFKPLNPYSIDMDMFKVEDQKLPDGKDGPPLRNVSYLGISAKRYALYKRDAQTGKIELLKYSSHGLGNMLSLPEPTDPEKPPRKYPLDQEKMWEDIIRIHHEPEKEDEFLRKYDGKVAIYQQTISKYSIYKNFEKLNAGKPLEEQIKPNNFCLTGMAYQTDPETGEPIRPLLPYISPDSPEFDQIPYMPFIDLKSGKEYPHPGSMDTQFYYKPLREVVEDYMIHPEDKSEGTTGQLKRRHLYIDRNSVHYIGKETNKLAETEYMGVDRSNYTEYVDWNNILMGLKPKEAEQVGISKRNLSYLKRKIQNGQQVRLMDNIKLKLIKTTATKS